MRLTVRPKGWLGPSIRIDFLLVVVISLVLRSSNLSSLPIFTDEAIYLRWASEIWQQRTRMALLIPISDDGKQPLFMWLAGGAMQLATDPLIAGRMVSVIAGVVTTVGIYFAGCWLWGNRAGLLSAFLYAVAPFTLLFDRMALADSLLTSTAAWSLALGIYLAKSERRSHKGIFVGLILGIVLGTAIWTKMTALFILPFPLLCLILVSRKRDLRDPVLGLITSYVIFGAFAGLLAFMPNAENLIEKTQHFSLSPAELLKFPVDIWNANLTAYWIWIQCYLPAPLYWLVLIATPWGLAYRRRQTLVLLACWAVFAIPPILTGSAIYTTRYVIPSILPLLLSVAELLVCGSQRLASSQEALHVKAWVQPIILPAAKVILLLAIVAPSLAFDVQLLRDPSSANLAETDRFQYVSGWPSGWGFSEAIELVRKRISERGGEVIVLSDHFHGLPRDGLAIYLSGIPRAHLYVDGHIPWGGKGIVEAWQTHQVPVIVVGAEGRNNLEDFERQVPEAKRIGLFWKPGGQFSFRVYEIDPQGS